GEMKVDVPAGGVVIFAPKQQNALRVTITDRDGLLARSGLVDGDLVIGADGKEWETVADIHAALAGARVRGEMRCLVLRGGRQLEITLDVKKLSETGDQDHGGRLDPTSR
ncbi:MAG: hypothetical protein ACE5JG_11700, partial [Planctomycetota bacterium]